MSDATPAAPAAPEAPTTPAPEAPESNLSEKSLSGASPTPTEAPRDEKGRFLTREERKAAAVAKLKAEAPAPAPEAKPDAAAPPAEAKPPEEKKPDAMSAKVAELVRREREAQKAEAERKAWLAEKAKYDAERKAWEERRAKVKEDPSVAFSLLEEMGLTYEGLTDAVLNGKAPKAEDKVAAAVAEAKAEVAALKKRLEDKEAAEAAAAAKSEADAYFKAGEEAVKAAADKYPLTLKHKAGLETARAFVIAHAKETGEVLPFADACARVEAELAAQAEEWRALLSPQSGTPTVSATGGRTPPPESAAPQAASDVGPKTTPRTLSNAQATAAPPKTAPNLANLSRSERLARAKALFAKGQG